MNIQTAAFKIQRKPKKEIVQEIIEQMYENTDDNEIRHNLASMYKFFMPANTAKAKTATKWVYKAVAGSKDFRHYISQSYSDGEFLVATDGMRMHVTPTNLPEGFYDVNGNPISEDLGTFPQWKRIIPENPDTCVFDIDELKVVTIKGKNDKKVSYEIPYGDDVYAYLNKKHVDDFLNGNKSFSLEYDYFDVKQPVKLSFVHGDEEWMKDSYCVMTTVNGEVV